MQSSLENECAPSLFHSSAARRETVKELLSNGADIRLSRLRGPNEGQVHVRRRGGTKTQPRARSQRRSR